MTQYRMTEMLAGNINVSMEEARAALETSDWNMLDAALKLQQRARARKAEALRARRSDGGCKPMRVIRGLLARAGQLPARREDAEAQALPVTALMLLCSGPACRCR